MIKNAEAGDVLSFTVLLILTVVALSAGHLLGGPAFGDRVALGNDIRQTSNVDSNAHSADKRPRRSNYLCYCDLSYYN